MRIFAVGTKIFGGPGQHLGGPVPPRPQCRTAPAPPRYQKAGYGPVLHSLSKTVALHDLALKHPA